MRYRDQSPDQGFTIIELMIAISVLATVLLLTTVGIVRIGQGYYKGITQANTQQAARTLLDGVAQNIQFSGFTGVGTNAPGFGVAGYGVGSYNTQAYCVGLQRYSYVLGYQQAGVTSVPNLTSKHVIWEDTLPSSGCVALNTGEDPVALTSAAGSVAGANGAELIGNNMRLTNFSITPVAGTSNQLFTVSVTVMYGDDDLIDKSSGVMANWTCKPSNGLIGAAFCAKSALTTTVGKRLS